MIDGELNEVYQEFNPNEENKNQQRKYTSQITDTKHKALRKNKKQLDEAAAEPPKTKTKSELEIKLAEIDDLSERSGITKTERSRLREKALGLD